MKPSIVIKALSTAVLLLFAAGSTWAASDSISIDITANIKATTCDIQLTGGTGNGKSNTYNFGTMGSGDPLKSLAFSLSINECSLGLSKLKTTLTGTVADYDPLGFANNYRSDAKSKNMSVRISRSSAKEDYFVPNATSDEDAIVWTESELASHELPLLATMSLLESSGSFAYNVSGIFSSKIIFNFEYQ